MQATTTLATTTTTPHRTVPAPFLLHRQTLTSQILTITVHLVFGSSLKFNSCIYNHKTMTKYQVTDGVHVSLTASAISHNMAASASA